MNKIQNLVIIRGGGDLASGVAARLYNSGFKILILEIQEPSCIRREVSFSNAIYTKTMKIENINAILANSLEQAQKIIQNDNIAVMIDEKASICKSIKAKILVDAILAKKNLNTSKDMAQIVIAIGPGFQAGVDCDCVIESKRGHDLARVIYEGFAAKNTNIPGEIAGFSKQRVIHSPTSGIIKHIAKIGDLVIKNQNIAQINDTFIKASIDGVLRGLIHEGFHVSKNLKIADIDPRLSEQKNCFSISDKARSIGGGVLEGILHIANKKHISINF